VELDPLTEQHTAKYIAIELEQEIDERRAERTHGDESIVIVAAGGETRSGSWLAVDS